MEISRRAATVMLAALPLTRIATAQPSARTRVVLLGTKGGPTPGPLRAPPATAIVVDGHAT